MAPLAEMRPTAPMPEFILLKGECARTRLYAAGPESLLLAQIGWLITIEAAFSIVEEERQIRVETLIVSIFEEGM